MADVATQSVVPLTEVPECSGAPVGTTPIGEGTTSIVAPTSTVGGQKSLAPEIHVGLV